MCSSSWKYINHTLLHLRTFPCWLSKPHGQSQHNPPLPNFELGMLGWKNLRVSLVASICFAWGWVDTSWSSHGMACCGRLLCKWLPRWLWMKHASVANLKPWLLGAQLWPPCHNVEIGRWAGELRLRTLVWVCTSGTAHVWNTDLMRGQVCNHYIQ